jgi:two-component system nitrogen regulation response regulator NtrX
LISATNQELQGAIREGRFREDLYFRLAGVTLYVPPLRSRKQDIPLLVEQFWKKLQAKYGRSGPVLTREAIEMLEQAPWPGNVRQLRSAVERLFVLAREGEVQAADVTAAIGPDVASSGGSENGFLAASDMREARRRFEVEFITRKLREHGGNVTRTASAIGLERQSLQEKIRKLGIERP